MFVSTVEKGQEYLLSAVEKEEKQRRFWPYPALSRQSSQSASMEWMEVDGKCLISEAECLSFQGGMSTGWEISKIQGAKWEVVSVIDMGLLMLMCWTH